MEAHNSKMDQVSDFLDLIIDIIRGLGQMAETIDFSLNPVDGLQSMGFKDFSSSLLLRIINNLGVKNYPTKSRCRMLTSSRF